MSSDARMATRVSVAMCTCNGASFVEEQVRSICRQSLAPFELVVRDDASDDDTVERIRDAWARHAPRLGRARLVLTVNPTRLGVARNFTQALADCSGDLVALSDQDDYWLEERLARLVARMSARPDTLLLHGDAILVDERRVATGHTLFQALAASPAELRKLAGGRAFDVLLDRNLVTGATTIVRRELLDLALPVPEHWLHDEWLGVVAAALGGLEVERQPLIEYRQHGANQIGARRRSLTEETARAFAPRGNWHSRRLARARELVWKLESLGARIAPATLHAARQKVGHHQARAALPAARWARLVPIVREIAARRYHRYGRGWRGVIKDLLEAA